MNESQSSETREHTFARELQSAGPSADHLVVHDLKNVRLTLTADLGEASLTVRDILELREGSVIPLSKLAGETTDLYVNGIPLARGEVVVIADALHVRISEVLGVAGEEKEPGESV
jgi:flagellar motor switch protein FliN/FliY